MSVHVLGNACIDTTFHVGRFPVAGETLVALSSSSGIGGKGANQALAAARAGAVTHLHAAVGSDEAAARIRAALRDEHLSLCIAEFEGRSDSSIIFVRSDGENLIVSDTGCARRFDPIGKAGFPDRIAAGDIALLQGNLAPATTDACLRQARARSAFTALNPSPLDEDHRPDWSLVDLVVANLGEIRSISGEPDPETGAAWLAGRGVRHVAVTLGSQGVLLAGEAGIFSIDVPDVAAVDTSGAGDVLCGVAIGLLAQGHAIEASFARAVAAAALSVTRPGALDSCPSSAEIARLALPSIQRRSS